MEFNSILFLIHNFLAEGGRKLRYLRPLLQNSPERINSFVSILAEGIIRSSNYNAKLRPNTTPRYKLIFY